jgi:hypothetical protein
MEQQRPVEPRRNDIRPTILFQQGFEDIPKCIASKTAQSKTKPRRSRWGCGTKFFSPLKRAVSGRDSASLSSSARASEDNTAALRSFLSHPIQMRIFRCEQRLPEMLPAGAGQLLALRLMGCRNWRFLGT